MSRPADPIAIAADARAAYHVAAAWADIARTAYRAAADARSDARELCYRADADARRAAARAADTASATWAAQ